MVTGIFVISISMSTRTLYSLFRKQVQVPNSTRTVNSCLHWTTSIEAIVVVWWVTRVSPDYFGCWVMVGEKPLITLGTKPNRKIQSFECWPSLIFLMFPCPVFFWHAMYVIWKWKFEITVKCNILNMYLSDHVPVPHTYCGMWQDNGSVTHYGCYGESVFSRHFDIINCKISTCRTWV